MANEVSIPETFTDPILYDANEQDLVNRALSDAQTKLPEWTPLAGHTEVVLTEGLALLVAELVFAINRLPERTLQGLLALYGLERDLGSPVTGTVRFTIADALGFTIPKGTALRAFSGDTAEEVDLVTAVAAVVAPGATTIDVAIVGIEPGIAGNGLPPGTVLEVLDAVPYIESALTVNTISGGRDAETDMDYYNRGAALLSRLTATLVLPSHFRAAALEDPTVGQAIVFDLFDPESGNDPGDDLGHVTVVVTDEAGLPLTGPQMTALRATLVARAHSGLELHVVAPDYEAIDVTATIVVKAGYVPADVEAAVEAALTTYLSPGSWGGGDTVYRNELISLIDQVPGVQRVAGVTVPAADVVLTGVMVLPEPGALAVTAV